MKPLERLSSRAPSPGQIYLCAYNKTLYLWLQCPEIPLPLSLFSFSPARERLFSNQKYHIFSAKVESLATGYSQVKKLILLKHLIYLKKNITGERELRKQV